MELEHGTFDGEAVYGAFPDGVRARPESLPARADRKSAASPCRHSTARLARAALGGVRGAG
jgi:hypothetical protein